MMNKSFLSLKNGELTVDFQTVGLINTTPSDAHSPIKPEVPKFFFLVDPFGNNIFTIFLKFLK